jgi:hypothetical protein
MSISRHDSSQQVNKKKMMQFNWHKTQLSFASTDHIDQLDAVIDHSP